MVGSNEKMSIGLSQIGDYVAEWVNATQDSSNNSFIIYLWILFNFVT